ncbi:MAG: hypothetical protein ACI85F_002596 [Bacteroidia bacterium]|jgi:hypothetical protein
MKRFTLPLFFILLNCFAFGQSASELVEQANQLLTDGKEYPAAISKFTQALQSANLEAGDKVRTEYGLADAKLRESQVQVNKLGGKDVPDIYREYIYDSVDHLDYARKNIQDKPGLENSVEIKINSLEKLLTRNIMQLVQEHQKRTGAEKARTSKEILRACTSVQKLNPDNYSAWDYQGQVQLTNLDSAAALSSLQKAVQLYETGIMPGPDAYAGYMYYRIALLQNNFSKDLKAAQLTLQNGLKVIAADREKVTSNVEMKQIRKDMILPNLDAVESKIDLFLVDLLIRNGAESEEQKLLIQETVAKYPDNVNLMFQYAKMVSEDDPETAVKVYDMIISKEPTNSAALYNAGVLHFNLAASIGAAEDMNRFKEKAIQDKMHTALEYFMRAEQMGQKAAIGPILQIAQQYGDEALYQKYAARQ